MQIGEVNVSVYVGDNDCILYGSMRRQVYVIVLSVVVAPFKDVWPVL